MRELFPLLMQGTLVTIGITIGATLLAIVVAFVATAAKLAPWAPLPWVGNVYVVLFDEVTSALDPELCGEVLNVIRRLGSEHNLTMLMVTHQMGFAEEFADRVCFFSQGKIIEQGLPQQFFSAPEHERTKQFLRAVKEAM